MKRGYLTILLMVIACCNILNAGSLVSDWYATHFITPPNPIIKINIEQTRQSIDPHSLIMTLNYQIQEEIDYLDNDQINSITSYLYNDKLTLHWTEKDYVHEEDCFEVQSNQIMIPSSGLYKENGLIDYPLLGKKLIATFLLEGLKKSDPDLSDSELDAICLKHTQNYNGEILDDYRTTFNGLEGYRNVYNQAQKDIFQGNWNTSYGFMRIVEVKESQSVKNANDITKTHYKGIYNKPKDGKQITGTLLHRGNQYILVGQWENPINNKKGDLEFYLNEGQDEFLGTWNIENSTKKASWNGSKVITDEEQIYGTWNLAGKDVVLQHGLENNVVGHFNNKTIKIIGDITRANNKDEYIIEGSWIEVSSNKVRGKLEFIYNPKNREKLIFKRTYGEGETKWKESTLSR